MTIATRMTRLQDEELVQIGHGAAEDGFEPEFVEAARAELQRRGIGSAAIDEIKYEAEELKAFEDANMDEPLGWFGRIGFMLFGFTTIGIFFAAGQKHLGYARKSRDARLWTFYGLGLWASIVALFALTDAFS